jgi:hypothetical protein
MTRCRILIATAIAAALCVTAVSGPAAAFITDVKVTVVNGIPNRKVDVCLPKNLKLVKFRVPLEW